MIYEQDLTIPANTPESAPATETLFVHPGIVKRVEIFFPPGPSGLAHVRIFYMQFQLWPSNPDSSFRGDDNIISFEEDLELKTAPFEFTLKGWNLDDTYSHTPIVRIGVIPFDRDIRKYLANLSVGATGPKTAYSGNG